MRHLFVLLMTAAIAAGCSSSANTAKEKETLMRTDNELAASVKDMDKFISYYAADATVYPPGMPMATGTGAIRTFLTEMGSTPGFSLELTPARAEVSASGDIGYTSGSYQSMAYGAPEKGKYLTVWKKQSDGNWKITEDIFNADSNGTPTAHAMMDTSAIQWGDGPPSLPPGAKMAVIAGDPSKPGPFVIRAQVPAGYKVAPHWHPGDENLTILSGTVALGMGDTWDEPKMQAVGTGGYAALPAKMHHYFLAKSAATFQVHGMGPFAINYLNPADDPSRK